MDTGLLRNAAGKFAAGFLILAFLLFLPAGTVAYPNGWLFCALLFIPMLILGIVLLKKAPGLLEKRLDTKERETTQKLVTGLCALVFFAGFITAGLDFRFGWSAVPVWVVLTASVLFLIAYALYAEVMRENAYLSRTVTVQENQKVIDTGLYGVVRHPMYAATVLLFLMIPLVLGSWTAFAVFLLYVPLIIIRIRNEEAVLEAGLAGYTEYKKQVRYRLIPYIW
ncbi:MAG: isoprenylcysteine carboxylmethyltransferase family protein [Methanocorpusculum sp.]|nr:isoprenylcysteine carboxylmethyltransferase family protein [Methanocorpusculum sp.]